MPICGTSFTGVFYLSTVCIVDVNYNKDKIVALMSYVAKVTMFSSNFCYI